MYTYIYTHTYMLSINMYIYTCTASMLLPALPSTPRLMALSMLSFGMLLALVTMMMGECHQYKTHTHTSILHRIRRGRDPHHNSAYIIYIYTYTFIQTHTDTQTLALEMAAARRISVASPFAWRAASISSTVSLCVWGGGGGIGNGDERRMYI